MMTPLVLFLAGLLGASALHKLLARQRLVAVTARLAGVGPFGGGQLLALAASIEGLAAVALVVPGLGEGGLLAAVLLWLGYAAALWRHRGKVLDCGCDLVSRERPVDAIAIARPLLLAALALVLVLTGPIVLAWTPEVPFAALALLALWFAAGELHSLPHLSRARS
jgi:hypothetical protein